MALGGWVAVAEHRRQALIHSALASMLEDGTYAALLKVTYPVKDEEGAAIVMWFQVAPLAARLGIGNSAANNRLTKLVRLGILERRRVDGSVGKLFEYRVLVDP